jgi:hypothetical protein
MTILAYGRGSPVFLSCIVPEMDAEKTYPKRYDIEIIKYFIDNCKKKAP